MTTFMHKRAADWKQVAVDWIVTVFRTLRPVAWPDCDINTSITTLT